MRETFDTPERPWISLQGVCVVRSGRLILDDICWNVAKGEHWVLMGPNGSGKTTLLLLLAGYLWPTRGTVTVLGKRFGEVDLRELRKKIGWVGSFLLERIPASEKALNVVLSGFHASLGMVGKATEEEKEKAVRLAFHLDCGDILESPYGVLSQGEKQRLLIARALMNDPSLLILDEPCAGLDPVAREDLLVSLEGLGRDASVMNLILVTHHLQDVGTIFSHAAFLRQGRILDGGTKERLFTSESLSRLFGAQVHVKADKGRYWAFFTRA